jgi:hypothetical protein
MPWLWALFGSNSIAIMVLALSCTLYVQRWQHALV